MDLVVQGHTHNYERYFDVAPQLNEKEPWKSGISTQSTVNPPAATYRARRLPWDALLEIRFYLRQSGIVSVR